MDVINGTWIKSRLTGEHGEKARLARYLGISVDKLSKTLAGSRDVQPEEVPKLLEFFNARIVTGDPDGDLTESEIKLLSIYRRIPKDKRPLAVDLLRTVQGGDPLEVPEDADADEA